MTSWLAQSSLSLWQVASNTSTTARLPPILFYTDLADFFFSQQQMNTIENQGLDTVPAN